MIKEAVGTGNTVDEAKEEAILALGASADADVQIEILEMPKKKVLGVFGGSPAKVRVFVELPDIKEKTQSQTKKKKENKKVQKKEPKKVKEIEKKAKPIDDEHPQSVELDMLRADSKAYKAAVYLKSVLEGLGCENTAMKVAEKENSALISLEGEGLGVVIGRRGETLEALQFLVSLAANNGGGYFRVNINVGDYREKRIEALNALANRIAKQVLSTGKNRALEPMSAYERRIIHTAVQEIEGVESNSIGDGENRRVVIHEAGKSVDAEGDFKRVGRSRGHDRKNSNVVSAMSVREPKKDSDVPLYGKIQ